MRSSESETVAADPSRRQCSLQSAPSVEECILQASDWQRRSYASEVTARALSKELFSEKERSVNITMRKLIATGVACTMFLIPEMNSGAASAAEPPMVRIAEIEIDPQQLEA